jgi:hypothetical protein
MLINITYGIASFGLFLCAIAYAEPSTGINKTKASRGMKICLFILLCLAIFSEVS